ncbi:RHS repeat-associated core domain-containing protein, partial [Pseudomonas sp. ES1]|uniref:RHS repeat-associated core domain-containing protein n=1 Tax=Pseudomonas sp. ES1 TaxID=3424775 RepID=UPI003D350A3C
KTQELNRPLEADPRCNKLMDNLLREYAGTHYKYDERGNLIHRLHNGSHAHFTWDLFDRLASYNDDKLKVDYSYDALGRRLHKHSVAHFWDRPEAGTGWNQLQRAKRQRDLGCGFTLFGWDGDTLAWESSPPLDEGDTGRTVHYLYEPGSFVPVAQALRKSPIRLHKQPNWSQREYDFDRDPLWHTEVKPQAFEAIAWYHCDHLGTPMELTDEQGNVAWAGQYKAWGEVREERSLWAKQHGLGNPIRFQGQYHDHETGLHYNRYRYYDPAVGRFVGQDPISYAGGLNLATYVPNPIDWIDPLGLAKVIAAKSRREAMRVAQQHAQVPRVRKGGEEILSSELNSGRRGKQCSCLLAKGISTLGRRSRYDSSEVFDHLDGHPHMVGADIPITTVIRTFMLPIKRVCQLSLHIRDK